MLDADCGRCDFMEEDCDYQSETRWRESEPCGGYILIKLLSEKGIIDRENLEDLSGE